MFKPKKRQRKKRGLFHAKSFNENLWREQVTNQDLALLYASHYNPARKRYFNPWMRKEKSIKDIMRWVLAKNHFSKEAWAYPGLEPLENDGLYLKDSNAPDSLTMLGHSSLALQESGQVLLFDPFFSDRTFNIKRSTPVALAAKALPEDIIVVISHSHYDHLDKRVIKTMPNALFVCPLGIARLLRSWGVSNIIEMDWWQDVTIKQFHLTCLPAHHWSRRFEHGTNRSLWASWLVAVTGHKLYFGGDSAYFVGYREFGRLFPDIDIALLPCGASAPRWFMHQSHTNVTEMFLAFEQLGASYFIPIHWGSMALGFEPPNWPAKQIQDKLNSSPELKDKVIMMPVGERLMLWP